MEGDVPTPQGVIHIRMDRQQVTVRATHNNGWLLLPDRKVRVEANQEISIAL